MTLLTLAISPSQITFSPLFTVCNHLPLDLVMSVSNNSPARQARTPGTSEPLLSPGKGLTAPPSSPELLRKGSPNTPESRGGPPSKTPEPIFTGNTGAPDVFIHEPILTPDSGSESTPTPDSEPVVASGNGQTTILHSLSADTWYNLRFKTR